MRTLAIAALVLAVPALAIAQSPVSEDLKKFNGFYKPESVQLEGKEAFPDAKSKSVMTLVIKDAEYRMYYLSDAQKDLHVRVFTGDLKIDSAAKTFELVVKEGQKKGEKVHGIYELSEKQLKLCYSPVDKPRPTAFASAAGSGCFLETWVVEKR